MKLTVAIDRTVGRTIYRWHVRLYRLTRGVIGHKSPVGPMLLLEVRGRKSGQTRSVTLLYYEKEGPSTSSRPTADVRATPSGCSTCARIRTSRSKWARHDSAAVAREIPSTDDPQLWNELVRHYGGWGDYQQLTERTISAVELRAGSTPTSDATLRCGCPR